MTAPNFRTAFSTRSLIRDTVGNSLKDRSTVRFAGCWPGLHRLPARGPASASMSGTASCSRREKRRHRFDLVGHDLCAAADHEVDRILPLFRGLFMDLDHPAKGGVTGGTPAQPPVCPSQSEPVDRLGTVETWAATPLLSATDVHTANVQLRGSISWLSSVQSSFGSPRWSGR